MSMLLQIVLSLSIVTVTILLGMLLVQARRTAASVERLAESAAQDLHRMAGDVHELRLKVVEVADLARGVFELPSTLTQVVAGVVRGMPAFFVRRRPTGRILEALLTGIQSAVHLLRGRKAGPPEEGSRA
ncbi:hypothetical protein GETHPA_18830 [Geothrix rubra]|uniref:DUF948 domain-containing protein n=1 Tax=Geothrix rubra TaxID=2927977 RepID=A0ABQ5Q7H8_9BACT|nr:hypothetical protein [Geothrix rubra]GLH70350.1 hypothetical protein GETHPA_18830 [Geothrix rubra]